MLRLLMVSVTFLLLACTPVQATVQQPPTPPRPTVPMTELHYQGTQYGDLQVLYFEHDGIRCYISREHSGTSYGGTSSGGGISCVRK